MPNFVPVEGSGRLDILIVIASAELSRIIGDVLRAEGHAVWEAADARTAFRALMSRLPDVVLLDTKLPDIGGVDVLRAMRESPGGRGVTALLMAEDPLRTRWEARDLEPERVLAKPLDVLDLTDLVRELAARKSARVAEGEATAAPPRAPTAHTPPLAPAAQMASTLRSIPPEPLVAPPRPPAWADTPQRSSPPAPVVRPTRPAPAPSDEGARPSTRTMPPGAMTWSTASQPPPSRPPPFDPAARATPPASPPASPRFDTRTSIPPTTIPPAPRASAGPPSHPPTQPDAWGVLGIPRGSSPEVIQTAVERLVAQFSETANNEKSLDARARASSMVARVRAARRQLLGDAPSPLDPKSE
jgi:CheY-like chemotaxis protein